MEDLIKALDELYASNEETETENGYDLYFQFGELALAARSLCDDYLITQSGGCNWKNIDELGKRGYLVSKGESDSFGWLTGLVRKKGDNRVLVYG